MKTSRRFLVPMFTKPKTNAVALKALSYGPLNKEQAESCLCPLVQIYIVLTVNVALLDGNVPIAGTELPDL